MAFSSEVSSRCGVEYESYHLFTLSYVWVLVNLFLEHSSVLVGMEGALLHCALAMYVYEKNCNKLQ